jgi:hypothetical protein
VVSPHKVQEFLNDIKNYTLQHYSSGLHKIFETGGEYVEPEVPAQPHVDATAVQMKIWENAYKNYSYDKRKFDEDKIKLVGTILGQLSKESVDVIRQTEDGREGIDKQMPLTLIKAIVSTHLILGKVDDEQNLYEARRIYENMRQGEKETLDSYCRRFEAAVASVKEAASRAEMEEECPNEKLQAIHFVRNVNDKYSLFKDNVQRGIIAIDDTVRDALEAAIKFGEGSAYRPISHSESRGVFASTRGRGGRVRGRGHGGGRTSYGPSAKYPCKICNSTDHWAKDCPDGEKKPAADSAVKKAVDEVRAENSAGGGASKKKKN